MQAEFKAKTENFYNKSYKNAARLNKPWTPPSYSVTPSHTFPSNPW